MDTNTITLTVDAKHAPLFRLALSKHWETIWMSEFSKTDAGRAAMDALENARLQLEVQA